MDAEHLEYFKAALEGRATVGWNVWFAANQHALAQQLSRPALLRLKFNRLDEAERLLAEAGIVPQQHSGQAPRNVLRAVLAGRGGRERSPATGPLARGARRCHRPACRW